ncbi:MAG: hypothetical protein K2Y30_01850 [Flavobacteriaceae bacterium]|nr:hypothetical protein [Flavobacteriaceae bacterium]
MKTVLITDEKHPNHGQRLTGSIAYHDIYHTGNGPDLYIAETVQGINIRLLSDQIDIKDYQRQEKQQTIDRLGVQEGDIVMISRMGSGSFCAKFDTSQPHLITAMSDNGNVEFDNGKANCYMPDMVKYDGDLPAQTDFTKIAVNNGFPF